MIPEQQITQMGWTIVSNALGRMEISWCGHSFYITEHSRFFALTVNDHAVHLALNRSCGSKIPPASYIFGDQNNLLAALRQCQIIIEEKNNRSKQAAETPGENVRQRSEILAKDIDALRQKLTEIEVTERESFVKQRRGQEKLREFLMINEGSACVVTGITVPEVLRASHIAAWKDDPVNRLVPENALLLAAHLDALFDKHLISFDPDDGHMLISDKISPIDRTALGLSPELKIPVSEKRSEFLRIHREIFLQRATSEN